MIDLTKKFLIYGYGISNKSVVKYLKIKKSKYNIYDDNLEISKVKNFINKDLVIKNIKKFDYIVISPSIKLDKNHFLYAFKKKIIIDLDFLTLELKHQLVIGVTGTEGKSTSCQYIYQTLSKKYKSIILGNYGNTILDKNYDKNFLNKFEIIIIELSSYQLDKIRFLKIDHALITNIYIDHINYHGNFENYVKSKLKIVSILKKGGTFHICNKDYKLYNYLIKSNYHKTYKVTNTQIINGNLEDKIMHLNKTIVLSIIRVIDASLKIDISTLKNLPYRNQLIKNTKKLKIYNDSKCTNLENAIMKNDLLTSKKKILILGGRPKPINNQLLVKKTLILIFGNYSHQIIKQLKFQNSNFFIFLNLFDLLSFIKIINFRNEFDTILFSPGGESFDLYNDFNDRGKSFNSLIRKLKF